MGSLENIGKTPSTEASASRLEKAGELRAAEHAEWAGKRGEQLEVLAQETEKLGGRYRAIQTELISLRKDLTVGTERAVQQNNPGMDQLALNIRKVIEGQIKDLEIEEQETIEGIIARGGNSADYTVQ